MPTQSETKAHQFRVEQFTGDAQTWDHFVRSQRGWTHFHLFDWKNVIENVFGHECIYLAAIGEDGALAGVLPLVQVRSRTFGHYLVSMPFLNYGGPLGSVAAVGQLVHHAVAIADEARADLLELRCRDAIDVPLPVSHRKIGVVLDLPPANPADLWAQFKSKRRTRIRRAENEGVDVRFGLDQLDPFYSVFAHHMRDLGTPTQPHQLFKRVAEYFPNDVRFGCAYLRGVPVAAGCGLQWGRELEITWGASLTGYDRFAPNMLLYWKFMERAIGEHLKIFNFGRCSPGSGTHHFKLQWGSRETPLFWYQHGTSSITATPSPQDSRYSWGPRIWKRIPVRLANVIGPPIARYIP